MVKTVSDEVRPVGAIHQFNTTYTIWFDDDTHMGFDVEPHLTSPVQDDVFRYYLIELATIDDAGNLVWPNGASLDAQCLLAARAREQATEDGADTDENLPSTAFECVDCKVNTALLGEYYMLHHWLWRYVHPRQAGMLCIACVERRLARPLTPKDFLAAPINNLEDLLMRRSPLLTARLGG